MLENVQALDILLGVPAQRLLVLDQINGDDCSQRSFMPTERSLKPGESLFLAPAGGRSSNGTFPTFNVQYGDEGFFTAIGWTGQWSAAMHRQSDGAARLAAGMELTHFRLRPGEAIRTPRIMLLRWSGDRIDAHNNFRRLLLAHYLPKLDGRPVEMAIAAQSFNRTGGQGYWATEAGQVAAAAVNRDLGCDTLWFDAGWFGGNFPNGVGNWFPKPQEFPHGLRPVGDACRKLGLKFLVWYEPERVAKATQIAREHPDFVLPAKKIPAEGGLFNLGDPQRGAGSPTCWPGRSPTSAFTPTATISTWTPCPSGGRTIRPTAKGSRKSATWKDCMPCGTNCGPSSRRCIWTTAPRAGGGSTWKCSCGASCRPAATVPAPPGRSEWDQCQTYGLNLYLPLHATIGWDVGAYECRSSATGGFCGEWDILNKSFPMDAARASIAEIKANRKYWYGDFYPLTPCTPAADAWMAWQLHRADLDEGIVLAFRRKDCPEPTLHAKLRGLKPGMSYVVEFLDDRHQAVAKTLSGRELASLVVNLPSPHSSLAVRYAPLKR